jgi:hypothetical protein
VKYVYEGPGPQEDPALGLVRPGDEREFGEEPSWGPWRCLDEPPEPPATPDGTPPPDEPPETGTTTAAATPVPLKGI